MRNEQEPILVRSDQMGDEYDHPAYGTIRCGRVSGHTRLFGSELVHQHYVSVQICRATKTRSLHDDRIFGHRPFVEINMSEHQWASFVSSMNMGSGVPCTITDGPPDGTQIEAKPGLIEPNKHDLAKKELSEYGKEINRKCKVAIEKLEALVSAPGSPNKTVLRELIRDLGINLGNLGGNMSFHVEQHQEMMEKNVQAAKSDVEGYLAGMATTLGLDVMRKMAPQLESRETVLALEDGS